MQIVGIYDNTTVVLSDGIITLMADGVCLYEAPVYAFVNYYLDIAFFSSESFCIIAKAVYKWYL